MAKGDIPNTNTQSTANSVDQKMQPTGNTPLWQQVANSNSSYPMSQFRQPGIGPFGSMMPNQRPQNNFSSPLGGIAHGIMGGGNKADRPMMPPQGTSPVMNPGGLQAPVPMPGITPPTPMTGPKFGMGMMQ